MSLQSCVGSLYTTHSDAETPLYVLAVPFGPTSVHVIWGTIQPLKRTLGYRIYYRGPTNGSVDIEDPDVNNWVITGLKNNGTYRVFVAGKSNHLPSERQESNLVHLGDSLSLYEFVMSSCTLLCQPRYRLQAMQGFVLLTLPLSINHTFSPCLIGSISSLYDLALELIST